MYPTLGSDQGDGSSIHQLVEDLLGERIEALAGWIQELDAQVRATAAAADEKTLKELRRALEAWSKRDPKFEERLTDRVDVLADRLATLSSAVNTTAAAHAGSDGEIATIRRELEQETAKLHALLRERDSASAPQEVEELRAAIAELSAGRPRGRSDDRYVAGLQEKVDNLGERIDTLAKTVATTAAGLSGREGELAALRKALEEGDARLEQMVAALRLAGDRTELAGLEAQVSGLAQKIATTTAHVVQREQDTAALRSRVEEEATKGVAVANGLRASLDELRSKLEASIEDRGDRDALADLDRRVGGVGARLDEIDTGLGRLDARLDSVSATVDGASADISAKEHELAALQRHLDETSARLDAALAEVRETFASLPELASAAELEGRLAPLRAQLDGLVSRFGDFEQASTTWDEERAQVRGRLEAMASAVAEAPAKSEVESLVAGLSTRLEELAGEQTALMTEIARTRDASLAESARLASLLGELPDAPSAAELEARLAPLQVQLEGLATRLVEADTLTSERVARDASRISELAQVLAEAEQRLADLEHAKDAAAGEVQRASASWNEERDWVRGQLDAVVAAVAETPAKSDVEPLIAAVSRRVEELEREQTTSLAEITRAREESAAESARLEALLAELPEVVAPIPPSQDVELKRLLTAFADRIEAMEHDRVQVAAEAARSSQEELHQVRASLDELGARLTESETKLAAVPQPGDVADTFDELAARVAALENAPPAVAPAAPLPGDGRFRVELRALDLRMQHAEAAARENREAVLVQLERLASRIEWRLQRLEADAPTEAEEAPEERALGQVVPIRGAVET